MPTYAYKCNKCEHIFEKMLSMSDNKLPEKEPCPECDAKSVRQYFGSMPGFISSHTDTISKTSGDWRDLLKRIDKGAGRHSTVKKY